MRERIHQQFEEDRKRLERGETESKPDSESLRRDLVMMRAMALPEETAAFKRLKEVVLE
jgi:hypothetical protein